MNNNIYFCIASDELGLEVAWQWRDEQKQFFKSWIPKASDIFIIDELSEDDRERVKAEIMHEIEPELREERLRQNKLARERRK